MIIVSTNVKNLERSNEDLRKSLQETLGLDNPEAVPEIDKVVINVGMGDARENVDQLERIKEQLARITGQEPIVTRAHKSVADFGIRQGDPAGLKVTLRGKRMKDFVQRLIHLAIPMTKEFKGLDRDSFDGQANFTMGLEEQVVFPEITYDEADFTFGMDITFVTSVNSREHALELLREHGLPFKED